MGDYDIFWFETSKKERRGSGFRCSSCGAVFYGRARNNLHTHHIDGNKKNDLPTNLEVLCKWCHKKHHRRYRFNTFSYP